MCHMSHEASTASNLQQPRANAQSSRNCELGSNAGQMRAESLALDIMHETHSSISGHLTLFFLYLLYEFLSLLLFSFSCYSFWLW